MGRRPPCAAYSSPTPPPSPSSPIAFAESYGAKKAQRMMGLKFRDDRVPSIEEFTEAAQREGMRAVKLTPV